MQLFQWKAEAAVYSGRRFPTSRVRLCLTFGEFSSRQCSSYAFPLFKAKCKKMIIFKTIYSLFSQKFGSVKVMPPLIIHLEYLKDTISMLIILGVYETHEFIFSFTWDKKSVTFV